MKQHTLRSLLAATVLLFPMVRSAHAQWTPLNPVASAEQQPDGALITLKTGYLRLHVCTDSIVRVVYSLEANVPPRTDFIVTKTSWPHADFSLETKDPEAVVLKTSRLTIKVSRANSAMIFLDAAGKPLAQEDARSLTPVEVNGEKTLHSERFVNMWATQEAFYGLGQHQAGVWNYRGEAVDVSQDNTNIRVPFLLSSNGYGMFFNNRSRSRFNNRFVHAFYSARKWPTPWTTTSSMAPSSTARGRLPRADRAGAAVRQDGPTGSGSARTSTRRRTRSGRRAQVPRAPHPGGQHRAGLVLVEHHG